MSEKAYKEKLQIFRTYKVLLNANISKILNSGGHAGLCLNAEVPLSWMQ